MHLTEVLHSLLSRILCSHRFCEYVSLCYVYFQFNGDNLLIFFLPVVIIVHVQSLKGIWVHATACSKADNFMVYHGDVYTFQLGTIIPYLLKLMPLLQMFIVIFYSQLPRYDCMHACILCNYPLGGIIMVHACMLDILLS